MAHGHLVTLIGTMLKKRRQTQNNASYDSSRIKSKSSETNLVAEVRVVFVFGKEGEGHKGVMWGVFRALK